MTPTIEKISAVTLRIRNMTESVRFYRDVLGMELLFGGEDAGFSSLRPSDAHSAILNPEQGDSIPGSQRLIFYVTDVDALWNHLKDKGFDPEMPRDANWGERYFSYARTNCRLSGSSYDVERVTKVRDAFLV